MRRRMHDFSKFKKYRPSSFIESKNNNEEMHDLRHFEKTTALFQLEEGR